MKNHIERRIIGFQSVTTRKKDEWIREVFQKMSLFNIRREICNDITVRTGNSITIAEV